MEHVQMLPVHQDTMAHPQPLSAQLVEELGPSQPQLVQLTHARFSGAPTVQMVPPQPLLLEHALLRLAKLLTLAHLQPLSASLTWGNGPSPTPASFQSPLLLPPLPPPPSQLPQ